MISFEQILSFWFQGVKDSQAIDKKSPPYNRWFSSTKEFDQQIKQQFEEIYLKAKSGAYKDWEDSARGKLALIILFDQMSRNMYRDTERMYESDELALDLSLRIVKDEHEKSLQFIERVFIYMPLMHAEDLKIQIRSVNCFSDLLEDVRVWYPQNLEYYQSNLDYARNHYNTIVQYGRFPHRDKLSVKRLIHPTL